MSEAVTVRYFARFEEITGNREEAVPLGEEKPLTEFLADLTNKYPSLEKQLNHAAVAINLETVSVDDAIVCPGDEIALLPPFGGGNVDMGGAFT